MCPSILCPWLMRGLCAQCQLWVPGGQGTAAHQVPSTDATGRSVGHLHECPRASSRWTCGQLPGPGMVRTRALPVSTVGRLRAQRWSGPCSRCWARSWAPEPCSAFGRLGPPSNCPARRPLSSQHPSVPASAGPGLRLSVLEPGRVCGSWGRLASPREEVARPPQVHLQSSGVGAPPLPREERPA